MNVSYDPDSDSYWGREMWPMELEKERNKKTSMLHINVTQTLKAVANREGSIEKSSFDDTRKKVSNVLEWKSREDKVNNTFKQQGFWIVPPSPIGYYKCVYPENSKWEGQYDIPFYLILNEQVNEFINDESEIESKKQRINNSNSQGEIRAKIESLEAEIIKYCNFIYEITFSYAEFLKKAIDTAKDVEDYEESLLDSFSKTNTADFLESYYYGAVFGCEFAIYEKIDMLTRNADRKEHLSILEKLKPLTREYILFQIANEHYKRKDSEKHEASKPVVEEFLKEMEDRLTIHKEFYEAFNKMQPNLDFTILGNFVFESSGRVNEKKVATALKMIIEERHDNVSINYRKILSAIGNDLKKMS